LAETRKALADGRFDSIVANCDRAIVLSGYAGDVEARPAHELLAEYYLARRQYFGALREALLPKGCPIGCRLHATRALALIASGRLTEAEALLREAFGTADDPSRLRKEQALWDLPSDSARTPSALLATAYIERAMSNEASVTERGSDLALAYKIDPENASCALAMGQHLYSTSRFHETIPYLESAVKLGGAKTARAAEACLRAAKSQIAKATHGGSG